MPKAAACGNLGIQSVTNNQPLTANTLKRRCRMKTAPSSTNSVLQTFERKGPFMMVKAFVRQPPAGLWNQAGRPLGVPCGIVESGGTPSGRPLRENNFVIFPAKIGMTLVAWGMMLMV